MFRSIAKRVLSVFSGLGEFYSAERKVAPDLYSTPVHNSGVSGVAAASEYFASTVQHNAAAVADLPCAEVATPEPKKRFRRSREELRLGLTIEQAMAQRTPKPKKSIGRPKKAAEPKPACVALPLRKATGIKVAEGRIGTPISRANSSDLIETLPARTQVRARAVQRYRLGGGKSVLKADTLDLIEKAMAAGKVTVCPPFIDSDGFNHLTGKEG